MKQDIETSDRAGLEKMHPHELIDYWIGVLWNRKASKTWMLRDVVLVQPALKLITIQFRKRYGVDRSNFLRNRNTSNNQCKFNWIWIAYVMRYSSSVGHEEGLKVRDELFDLDKHEKVK